MSLPRVGEPLNGGGPTSGNWSRWFSFVDQTLAQLSTATTTPTESSPTTINQGNGIQVTGNPSGGYTISLRTVYATNVVYSNADSGLTATDAQAAIDELAAEKLDDAPSDGSTYGRKDGGWVVAAGSGDVVGPASATDSHVALFDGPTGKLLKDGGALATIATTGDVGDLTGFPGGTSDFLRADGTFATPSGGGGSTAWTLVKSWDFAVSGAVASIDESVAGYNEVWVDVEDVTLAAAGYRAVQVSNNGGTSYPTSYDYVNALGVRSTSSLAFMQVHNTTTTAARCGTAQFQLIAGTEVLFTGNQSLAGNIYKVPAFGTKINRVKVGGWTSAGVATNMTGGKVFIYAR